MSPAGGVEVVLATFNGAPFLGEQLASLAAQTVRPLRVVAGDDGSRDGSAEQVRAGLAAHGLAGDLVAPEAAPLGPRGNFSRLLARTTAPYVAFSDQDDRWDPVKLARMREHMIRAEAEVGAHTPLLVCCDLRLIDAAGRPLARSFWKHQGYAPARGRRFGSLLVMNCFPGCAMLMNRALVEAVSPIPATAVMHDWWTALTAAALGRVIICPDALMDYRLHPANVIGVPAAGLWALARKFLDRAQVGTALAGAVAQAQALHGRCVSRLDEAQRRRLDAFCALPEHGWLRRRWDLVHHRIAKHGPLRQLSLLLNC
jgi:glycosyltransferase involved in cell wall biosynthesis